MLEKKAGKDLDETIRYLDRMANREETQIKEILRHQRRRVGDFFDFPTKFSRTLNEAENETKDIVERNPLAVIAGALVFSLAAGAIYYRGRRYYRALKNGERMRWLQ